MKNPIAFCCRKFFVLAFAFIFNANAKAQCQAGFTFTVNNATATFTDISTFQTPMNYYWTFYLNPSNTQSTTYFGNNPAPVNFMYNGSYTVMLYIADTMPSTCNSTFIDTVVITGQQNPPCNAAFTYWNDTAQPYPTHIYQLQQNSSVNWLWDFGDGNLDSTSGSYVTHQYATPTWYLVTLRTITSMNDTCFQSDSVYAVSCQQLLSTSFTRSLNVNTVTCTANCSGANTPTYYWSFGDGNYSTQQNPVHTYLYNGGYTIALTYGDSMTCQETYSDTITITNASPFPCNAIFSYYNDTTGNYTVNYSDNSTMNIVSRLWSFPGGTPSTSTSTSNWVQVSYPGTGTYSASLTATNQSGVSCSYTYGAVTVGTSCQNTNAYFTLSPDTAPQVWQVNNMSTGTPQITYSWDWGDGSPISTGATPAHTYTTAGWYNICLSIVDANGCGASYCAYDTVYKTMSMISVYVINTGTSTGVNELSTNDIHFSVFPNPLTEQTSGTFELNATSHVELSVYDVTGRKVSELENSTLKAGTHSFQWNAQQVPAGMYWLKLDLDGRSFTRKLVVIK